MPSFSPSLVRAAALAALVAVAGCSADKPEAAAPAGEKPEAAAAAAEANAIGLRACPDASDGRIHFKVADVVLAVPSPIISDAVPAGLTPPITREQVAAALTARVGNGEGCPGKPLAVGLLLLKGKIKDPLLDGSIGLLALPPGGITKRFASETQRLQAKPGPNCQKLSDDLIGCIGTERRGDTTTEVMYVITTDRTQKMASGGPLAARCVLRDRAIAGCNMVDDLPGGMAIDASLKSGTYTTASLRAALDAAIAAVSSMRL